MLEFFEQAKGKDDSYFSFGEKHDRRATHFILNCGNYQPISELSLVNNLPDGDVKTNADDEPLAPPEMDFSDRNKTVEKAKASPKPKDDDDGPLVPPSTF